MKKRPRVLIVEDDLVTLTAYANYKKQLSDKVDVDLAIDAQETFKLCDEHDYDLIFMDICLPKVEGTIIAQTLIAKGVKAPIIGVSSVITDDNLISKSLDLGMRNFHIKPLKFWDFENYINHYIYGHELKDK